MSVKRYDVGMTEETNSRTGFYASFPRVYEAEQGQYVEYADYARLKAEVERLTAMANENSHLHKGIYSLSLNVAQLKDEVERLRASSFVTAVPVEEYEKLKADIERWKEICDELDSRCNELKAEIAAKEGKQP